MPDGQEVVSTGVSSLGDFFRGLGGIALGGISRRVDMELGGPVVTPDTAGTPTKVDPPKSNSLVDAVTALSPLQIGGLLIAGGLTWALATGKFR